MPDFKLKKRIANFVWPTTGALCGAIYVALDEDVLPKLIGVHPSKSLDFIHDVIDFILPVVFGIFVGIGINFIKKQNHLNRQLSFKNAHLQRDLLVSTLISQFLHEIRNPIHNLSAVLEDGVSSMSVEQAQAVQKALLNFNEVTLRYKNWESSMDKIDPREPVLLKPWLDNFIRDHLGGDLKGLGILYEQRVDPLLVRFHPILLEQALISVIANAFESLEDGPSEKMLQISATLAASSQERNVELRILNSGRTFPEDLLKIQGRTPVSGRQGVGFGLLLTRRVLEQARGDLRLENVDGMACVTLLLAGERI